MAYLDLQIAVDDTTSLPTEQQFTQWVENALSKEHQDAELTIRITDAEEIHELNHTYRNKDKATNVLSFPFEAPQHIELDELLLGDIVICQEVIEQEAKQQNKPLEAHWAHMVTHGVLHLLGYDHIEEQEAQDMESKEVALLAQLGIDNPYV